MSETFQAYALQKITVDWIHASPWIPARQLQNAIRMYARLNRQEKPLVLLDTSPMGNGETGALLTDHRLYAHCDGRALPPIAMRNMRSILLVPEYLNECHVFIDGRRVIHKALSFVDRIELKRFMTMMKTLAGESGAASVYSREIPILGQPEVNDLDDDETRQAMNLLLHG